MISSIVIVGGNDRMATRYNDISNMWGCKAKVFTQMPADFDNKLGSPDLMVVFTNTCSHKMLSTVNRHSQKLDIPVERVHSAGVSALKDVLTRTTGVSY